MDDAEADYVIHAVEFLAREGHRFLSLYNFDLSTGTWKHKHGSGALPNFSLEAALDAEEGEPAVLSLALRQQLYKHYLDEAQRFSNRLREDPTAKFKTMAGELGELQFFALPTDERQPH
jgi:hypothetical protein